MDNQNLTNYLSSIMYLIILMSVFIACTNDTPVSNNSADMTVGDVTDMTVGDVTDIILEECMLPTYNAPAMSGGIPIQELITQTSIAICLKLSECCAQDVIYYLNKLSNDTPLTEFTDEACQERISTIFDEFNLTPWIELAQTGKVEYHGEAAQEYITQLGQLTCNQVVINGYTLKSEIRSITNSQVKQIFQYQTACLGGPCIGLPSNRHGSCDSEVEFCCVRQADQSCAKAYAGDEGECVAVSKLDEPCSSFGAVQLCQDGVECSDEWDFIADSGFTCGDKPSSENDIYREGDGCDGDLSYYGSCEQGTYCDGVCVAPKELGEACESLSECIAMTYCDGGVCVAQKGEGEACVSSSECINSCIEQTCRALCLD